MKIFDISLPISEDLPIWPGDPKVSLQQLSAIKNGASSNVSKVKMSVHTGTHIDAPRHFLDAGKTIDQILLEKLIGEVLVIALDDDVEVISKDILINHPQNLFLHHTQKVLFKTRNSSLWQTDATSFQADYVGIDTSGAGYLAAFDLDLIGVDYLSIAAFHDTTRPHQILLEKEIVLLEGINLSNVPAGTYTLYCLPLLIANCEGAPARAILIE